MFFFRSTLRLLGILVFFSSFISHARYGLGLWVVGGGDLGGAFLSSQVVNPPGGINPNLQEQTKVGLLYNVKGGFSWFVSSVFALDVLGGYSSVDVLGKSVAGAKAVRISQKMVMMEAFPKLRFGDFGSWQVGPLYRGYFGSDTDFSESLNNSSNRTVSHFFGAGLNYDVRSPTEKTIYRFGLQFLTDVSEPQSIYMSNLSFQMGFDLFGREDDSMYAVRPEPYPGEEGDNLPAIQTLPVVENDLSVQESQPMPFREKSFEMPVEKNTEVETPFLQSVEDQGIDSSKSSSTPAKSEGSSLTLRLSSDSFGFGSGISHIGSSKTREYLQSLGAFLSKNNQSFQSLVVVGHTDKRGPKGREREVNSELSQARAKSVYEALIAGGASQEKLQYEGRAFDEPVEGAGDNPQGWKLNRRVELSLKDVSNPDSFADTINQFNEKFGIKEKVIVKP